MDNYTFFMLLILLFLAIAIHNMYSYSATLYFSGVIASAKFNIAEWREELRIIISIFFFAFIIAYSIVSSDYFFGDK